MGKEDMSFKPPVAPVAPSKTPVLPPPQLAPNPSTPTPWTLAPSPPHVGAVPGSDSETWGISSGYRAAADDR